MYYSLLHKSCGDMPGDMPLQSEVSPGSFWSHVAETMYIHVAESSIYNVLGYSKNHTAHMLISRVQGKSLGTPPKNTQRTTAS